MAYNEHDFEEMSNETLKKAIHLLVNGRQYEGIEQDKDNCLLEVKKRL